MFPHHSLGSEQQQKKRLFTSEASAQQTNADSLIRLILRHGSETVRLLLTVMAETIRLEGKVGRSDSWQRLPLVFQPF